MFGINNYNQLISTDHSVLEEIVRKKWPSDYRDADEDTESAWEILNETSSHDVVKRHWFKQNYIQHNENLNSITYH